MVKPVNQSLPCTGLGGENASGCITGDVDVWPGMEHKTDWIAEECAVALVYNGISHAVMMATPKDLEVFALGFSLTEGIIDRVAQVYDIQVKPHSQGIEIALNIASECAAGLKRRRRHLTGRTGCGLCGKESLEQVQVDIQPLTADFSISHAAIERAVQDLSSQQPLQVLTGAVHGAALCNAEGQIQWIMEDVGRHNALDKLIGEYCRRGWQDRECFVLVSSRASYEMVQKTARAGIAVLVAVSAATSSAIAMANRVGLTLAGFARPTRHVIYTHKARIAP